MKKRLSILLAVLLAVPLFAVLLAFPASAELQRQFFTNNDREGEMVICVEWETERPVIRFIAPDGRVYDPSVQQEGTMTTVEDGMLYYYIQTAPAGSWEVEFDKLSNENIYVTREKIRGVFALEGLTVNDLGGGIFSLSFSVYSDDPVSYDYTVSVTTSEQSASRELTRSWARSGEPVELNVDLSGSRTYDDYRLKVDAWYFDDGVEISDSAVTGPIAYVDPDQKDPVTEFFVAVYPERYSAVVTWEAASGWSYLVGMEESNPDPELDGQYEEFENVSGGENSCEFQYAADTTALKFSFSEKERDSYSGIKNVSVDLDSLPKLTLPEVEVTNSPALKIAYAGFSGDTEILLEVGESQARRTVSGDGTFFVEIPDSSFVLKASYKISDKVSVVYEREIYPDRIPPALYMLKDYTDLTTSEASVTVAGTAFEATSVTLAGEKVETDSNGAFIKDLQLAVGENVFELIAADAAGNQTLYRIRVFRQDGGASSDPKAGSGNTSLMGRLILWSPVIIAGLAAILSVIFALVFFKKKDRSAKFAEVKGVLKVLCGADLALTVYAFVRYLILRSANTSPDFVDLAAGSAAEASARLAKESYYGRMTVIALIVFAVLAIAVAVFALRDKLAAKKK